MSFLTDIVKKLSNTKEREKEKESQTPSISLTGLLSLKTLQANYIKAKSDLAMAQPKYESTQKQYYVAKLGQAGYDEIIEKKYEAEAEAKVKEYESQFLKNVEQIQSEIDTYKGVQLNYQNIQDLLQTILAENQKLEQQLSENNNDTTTNERKSYYTDMEREKLISVYFYILVVIYAIVLIGYIITAIRTPTPDSKNKWIILVLLIVSPFFNTWLLSHLVYWCSWLLELLPKNVY